MTVEEIVMQLRGLLARALVRGSSDAGQAQTVDVTTHEGVHRSRVEVLQPFGVASRPPAGAMTVVLAIGGDQGDLVALPVAAPGRRFGNVPAGGTVIYDAAGNRVFLGNDGIVEIHAATRVLIKAPEVRIEGNLVVTGSVADAAGTMQEMRDRYNSHTHGGPAASPLMD
jgi:phage gp45-like